MITITDTTQRVFFTPNRNVEIEGDVPEFGLFAVKGVVLTNVGTVKAEMPLNVNLTSRAVSIGLDLFVGLPDEDYIFNVEYINDIAPVVIDYFNRVAEDNGQSQQTIVEVTQRIMKIAQIDTLEKQIYQSRLKILRQSVERVKRSQPVTTRKVNRTVSI